MEQIKKLYEKTKQSLHDTNKNQPDLAIEKLKEVQNRLKALKEQPSDLKKDIQSLQIITLNNLAYAYSKKGKHKASIFYLQMVRDIQSFIFPNLDNSADPEVLHQVSTTYSNICAAFSHMGDHERAYKQISRAIDILLKTKQTSKSQALVVFYFNSAVELEYLNRLNEAQKIAQKGYSLSTQSKKQMQQKFSELLDNIQFKIKERQKKIAKIIMNNLKMKSRDSSKERQLVENRGNSLSLIQHNESTDNMEGSNLHYKTISKQFSSYLTRITMPKIKSSTKNMKMTQYPRIKLPNLGDQSKIGSSLGLQQRKKVISLYEPKPLQKQIPKNQRMSLKRKQQTLQKLVYEKSLLE